MYHLSSDFLQNKELQLLRKKNQKLLRLHAISKALPHKTIQE
jgi:hypothetical protein